MISRKSRFLSVETYPLRTKSHSETEWLSATADRQVQAASGPSSGGAAVGSVDQPLWPGGRAGEEVFLPRGYVQGQAVLGERLMC